MDKEKSNKTDVKDHANESAGPEVPGLSFTLESPEKLLKLLMLRPLPDQLNQNLCGCNQNQCFRVLQSMPVCSQVWEPLLQNVISTKAGSLYLLHRCVLDTQPRTWHMVYVQHEPRSSVRLRSEVQIDGYLVIVDKIITSKYVLGQRKHKALLEFYPTFCLFAFWVLSAQHRARNTVRTQ